MPDNTERLAKYYCRHCGESFWITETYGHAEKGDTHKCFCGNIAVRLGKYPWWADRELPPLKQKGIISKSIADDGPRERDHHG